MLADGPSHLPMSPSGYALPNLQTGRQQTGHPICQHFAQSANRTSTDGMSHLPIFYPICILDKMFPEGPSRLQTGRMLADGPSHLPMSPSGYALLNLQTGRQQMGCPICLYFSQSANRTSAAGTCHLPTFCPICRHFVQSAYWTKCSQMGHPVCRRARLQTGQNVGRWAIPSADGTRRQIGRNIIMKSVRQSANLARNPRTIVVFGMHEARAVGDNRSLARNFFFFLFFFFFCQTAQL